MAKKKITLNRVLAAIAEDSYAGFCLHCGEQTYGVDPDARNYPCDDCGKPQVYGAEEVLMRLA